MERLKFHQVTDTIRLIENYIDPFDWDVFLPHLTTNLHTLIRRTYNMYSCVARFSTTVQALVAATPTPSQQVSFSVTPAVVVLHLQC